MRPRGDELYVEEHGLLSPSARPGDPLDADAVVDALRALRTAYTLPSGSAVKSESAALHALFSPENDPEDDDKVKVEAEGLHRRQQERSSEDKRPRVERSSAMAYRPGDQGGRPKVAGEML